MTAQNASILVLISGSGSNLQALIDAAQANQLPGKIVAVISNNPEAYGLWRAKRAGIDTATLNHKEFTSRETFDQALAELIDQYNPDIIVLAGFMRILSEAFVVRYLGKLINIHPSLLPEYPGLNTHQRILDSGEAKHGASVHFVIPELDAGPVILQGSITVQKGESAEHLAARVLKVEHQIYPLAVTWLATKKVAYNNGAATRDGERMPVNGYIIDYNN